MNLPSPRQKSPKKVELGPQKGKRNLQQQLAHDFAGFKNNQEAFDDVFMVVA